MDTSPHAVLLHLLLFFGAEQHDVWWKLTFRLLVRQTLDFSNQWWLHTGVSPRRGSKWVTEPFPHTHTHTDFIQIYKKTPNPSLFKTSIANPSVESRVKLQVAPQCLNLQQQKLGHSWSKSRIDQMALRHSLDSHASVLVSGTHRVCCEEQRCQTTSFSCGPAAQNHVQCVRC